MALSDLEKRFALLGTGGWRCVYRNNGDTVVYPPGDDIVHRLDGDACPCGPSAERLDTTCGHDHYMYTHHSLDGRECPQAG